MMKRIATVTVPTARGLPLSAAVACASVRSRQYAVPRHGFTLLETLLVLLTGSMLLLAASSFLFGAISLRRQIEHTPQLGQHAASVARLLESLVSSAEPLQGAAASAASGTAAASASTSGGTASATTGSAGSTTTGQTASLINWQDLPAVVFGSDQTLFLRVRSGLPVFVTEGGLTQTAVNCYLLFEARNGLILFWQSERMRRDDENHWERTLLSPLVSAVSLLYYDAEREQWDSVDGMGQLFSEPERLPQVMQITFREPGSSREITTEVLLPPEATQLLGL